MTWLSVVFDSTLKDHRETKGPLDNPIPLHKALMTAQLTVKYCCLIDPC